MDDAERAAGETGHRGEPEELRGGELEADRRQPHDQRRDDEPDDERQSEVGRGDGERTPGKALSGRVPRMPHPRVASPIAMTD